VACDDDAEHAGEAEAEAALKIMRGSRPHALGGKIYELRLGDHVEFTWTPYYDHLEALQYALRGSVVVATASYAVGWMRCEGYARFFFGFGAGMVDWTPEPDE
jgi:hypothetical protein